VKQIYLCSIARQNQRLSTKYIVQPASSYGQLEMETHKGVDLVVNTVF
jgi:predicted secreted acid phosphatase